MYFGHFIISLATQNNKVSKVTFDTKNDKKTVFTVLIQIGFIYGYLADSHDYPGKSLQQTFHPAGAVPENFF